MTVLISRSVFFLLLFVFWRLDCNEGRQVQSESAVSVVQISGSHPGQSRSKGAVVWPEASAAVITGRWREGSLRVAHSIVHHNVIYHL